MGLRRITWLILCLPLAACASGAAVSSSPTAEVPITSASTTFVLREAPADAYCDAPGSDNPAHNLTFHIDPLATEQVSATTDTGMAFVTYWSPGFQPGTDAERVIRDPAGQVVVSDGDVVLIPAAEQMRLHGYLVLLCPAPGGNALYVLLKDPA